jgi:predicted small secreted protein
MKPPQRTLTPRIALLLLAATLLATVGAGCNTAKGFGKDVEKAGEKIQDGTD